MSTVSKVILVVVALIVVAFGVAFMTSRYLVSKLDGTGIQTPQERRELYSSEDGVSFSYPDTYELSSRSEGNAERQWDVLVLLPKGYVPPYNGEGPPAISMSVFANPEGLSLDAWIKGDSRSNWKLAAQDGGLGSTTVGGEPALAYRYSGLYETSAVAVAHKGKIFLFEAGWIAPTDATKRDFEILLGTVQFTQ